MTWLRNIGWAALAVVTLAIAIVPDLVTLPEPEGAIVLDRATFLFDGNDSEVSLPHAIYPRLGAQHNSAQYLIDFDLDALAVLRILQETITNALKHGPARKIAIRGSSAPNGLIAITIENDGRAFVENDGGHGLTNMRRRAQQLHGRFDIGATAHGALVTLLLPVCLPDFEDETA